MCKIGDNVGKQLWAQLTGAIVRMVPKAPFFRDFTCKLHKDLWSRTPLGSFLGPRLLNLPFPILHRGFATESCW